MGKNYKRRAIDNIKFSIGAKLITIISIIVIISLGSITALVSWLVREDLRIAAEDNNFEANRRSALEAESMIVNIRAHSRILLQKITSDAQGARGINEAVDFFFSENPQLAAFYIVSGKEERIYANKNFFISRSLDESLSSSFFRSQRETLGRSVRGETIVANAAPHFSYPLLALFFPWQNSQTLEGGTVGAVLFSSESLNNNFGFGANKSYMINNSGDVLVHSDFSFVRAGANIGGEEFIKNILGGKENSRQQLIEAGYDFLKTSENPAKPNYLLYYWTSAKQKIFSLLGREAGPVQSSSVSKKSGDNKKIRQFMAFTKLNSPAVTVITSIEYDKVFEGIAATTRRNILLTAAVLCICIIVIWFFAKTISVPIRALARAARKIEGGEFDLELKSKGGDEIGVLTSSFQKMCSALHIFGRFTNKDIAVKAMRGQIKPGGLPRHGTIFFSDIRGFTEKSENFTNVFGKDASDKIVFWLNHYFTQMIECVERTNGVVDKFIGDAVMAHWGTAYSAGSPQKDAFNCVKAALMMRKALYNMNKERRAGDPANPPIKIGCGINSGIVTAGQLGSEQRMEYTVIGDPVNLASRIEALTKPLAVDILISEDTWKLLGSRFIVEEMPSVTVKGKEKPVRIFAVVNALGVKAGPQTLAEVRELLGVQAPDLSKTDVNADEKKYKIGE
jgi:adenylate cyclase